MEHPCRNCQDRQKPKLCESTCEKLRIYKELDTKLKQKIHANKKFRKLQNFEWRDKWN
jgi:hypothetical protein